MPRSVRRHRERARQAVRTVRGGHFEACLGGVVVDQHRPAFGQHEAGRRVAPVRHQRARLLFRQEPHAAGHAQLQSAGLGQEDDRHVGLEGLGGHCGHVLQQQLRIARVHREAADLRHALRIARALERLLHARVGADIADRRHDVGQAIALQRRERDLHHHLGAVSPACHELHLRAHRPGTRVLAIGLPVGRVARPDRVRHEGLHRQARQLAHLVAEQRCGRRVGQPDDAAGVHQQQRIRIGDEERAEHCALVEPGRQFERGQGRGHGVRPSLPAARRCSPRRAPT